MLGYSQENLDEMIGGIQIAIAEFTKDPDSEETVAWLQMSMEFLQQLWDQGYFSNSPMN